MLQTLTPDSAAVRKRPVTPYQPLAAAIGGASPDARGGSTESVPNRAAGQAPAPTAAAAPTVGNPQPDAATTGLPDPYDYSQDPILQKIQAIDVAARSNARTAAAANAKALAIQFGDGNGFGVDDTTQQEAAGNPYSTLASLLHNYTDTAHQHDETLNKQNLFFSGTRVKALGDDANAYQQNVYNARLAALGQYGGIQSDLAGALSGADNSDIAAEGDAYGRAANRATTYGYDPGAAAPGGQGGASSSGGAATAAGAAQNVSANGPGPYIGTLPAAGSRNAQVGVSPLMKALVNPYTTGRKTRG